MCPCSLYSLDSRGVSSVTQTQQLIHPQPLWLPKIGATSAAIQNLSVELIPVFHWCAPVNQEREKKSKTSNSRTFHYFSDSPRTKSQCVFWRSKNFQADGNWDYPGLHQLLAWPRAFGSVLQGLGLTAESQESSPHPTAVCWESSAMGAGTGGSTRWQKSRHCAIRLFITHLSASRKAIGSLFFFTKNLPLCIAHIQLTIRCYADQCPKYQSSQMFTRALGKPYGLRTICILSWMCFNFYLLASAIVFTIF